MIRLFALLSALIATACTGGTPTSDQTATPPPPAGAIRYVAIGDSYTIGTGVTERERWPNQLVATLTAQAVPLELAGNLAVNGATSAEVLSRQVPRVADLRPDFVSVLVGVNDVVRGVPASHYADNLATLLDSLLAGLPPGRLLVVSTPDYTLTPMGEAFGDPSQQSAAIAEINRLAAEIADERDVPFVDISVAAESVTGERELVARDGLHPSGRQYGLWVELIAPVVRASLGR